MFGIGEGIEMGSEWEYDNSGAVGQYQKFPGLEYRSWMAWYDSLKGVRRRWFVVLLWGRRVLGWSSGKGGCVLVFGLCFMVD
jgi:hypothetical protein